MSEIPNKRFGETASADLEAAVLRLIEGYALEPRGEQQFSTESGTLLWLRFQEGCLTDLITEIAHSNAQLRTVINLQAGDAGYAAIETTTLRDDHTTSEQSAYTAAIHVAAPDWLNHTQYVQITDVLDEVKTYTDGEVSDRELDQILQQELQYGGEPLFAEARFARMKRIAGFVLTHSMHLDANFTMLPAVIEIKRMI